MRCVTLRAMAKEHLSIRAEQETIAKLRGIAAALSKRASGTEVTLSDATRIALERGVEVLERELDPKGAKPARKPKP